MVRLQKIMVKLNNNVFAWMAACLFFLSMLPIWYLAFYARPSGDDYGYSALTHAAWVDTHSLIKVLEAAVETVINNYNSWNLLRRWPPSAFFYSCLQESFPLRTKDTPAGNFPS